MEHVIVYREEGRYAGWPANYGMWNWGNEIVLSFISGYPDAESSFHARDMSKPFETIQARSLDGGRTWTTLRFPGHTPGGRGLSADEHMEPELRAIKAIQEGDAPAPFDGNVDFTSPTFSMMCARTDLNEGSISWFYVSNDQCHSWQGPYELPMFDQHGISARTDYIVNGPEDILVFLTATKSNGKEGRVFCARTTDGGRSFKFVSWIGEEPEGYTIMPASLKLADGRILCSIRCHGIDQLGNKSYWIDLYESSDEGLSWRLKNSPAPDTGRGGNPPTLNQLSDGRLVMTYGYRDEPRGMRARVSKDQGNSWGEEIILRNDAGSHDIGYPRSVVLPDDTVVTAYYYNDGFGAPCYIACTRWKP